MELAKAPIDQPSVALMIVLNNIIMYIYTIQYIDIFICSDHYFHLSETYRTNIFIFRGGGLKLLVSLCQELNR